jgi:hypothetical protein
MVFNIYKIKADLYLNSIIRKIGIINKLVIKRIINKNKIKI